MDTPSGSQRRPAAEPTSKQSLSSVQRPGVDAHHGVTSGACAGGSLPGSLRSLFCLREA